MPAAAMNDLEESTHRIEAVKKWLQDNNEEDPYNDKLRRDILQKKRFLLNARAALGELQHDLSTNEKLRGLSYTNDRVPFKEERGDSIGLSMAVAKLDSQVRESKTALESLQAKRAGLDEELRSQEVWNGELTQLVKELQDEIAKAPEDEPLEAKLNEEKHRYRQLRHYLAMLRETEYHS